jgi:FtsP/CotA-like multicopper oxidase with cupredoxin domain
MNIRTAKILGILLLLILATALCGLGLSLGSAESSRDGNHSFADKTGEGDIHRGAIALTDTPVVTPTPFSHPLLFPPVNTNANVSIGIDQACVQILDGPCTNMWTYGGTYPGITIRRPTGQTTNVTFTNNLDPAAGELTVHNHGNHSSATNDGQPDSLLIATGGSRTYIYDGLEEGANQRGKMQFYHDHRMDLTGRNVWMGLTGM